MDRKHLLSILLIALSLSLSAQVQTWQWVKAGGSSSDNTSVQPAECKIAGCDAKGNVYAVGGVNGPNMRFDTFSSAGAYSVNNVHISYLLFSYDCAGNMRWAKQIGDEEGNSIIYGAVTDPQGNTYLAANFWYGYYGGLVKLYLGDTTINSTAPVITQPYLCMVKYDSLGRLVWFKNFEEDTAYGPHSAMSGAFGLRIGSSGNLWMGCSLDSNYTISPNLHTTKKGMYNVQVDPLSGNIISGYYTSNTIFGDVYSEDTYYDLDENENFYQTGTLTGGDVLILDSQSVTPNPSLTSVEPYILSLDKNGNFRYLITNRNYTTNGSFASTKYDFLSKKLVTCWSLNSGDVYGNDTFSFNHNNLYMGSTTTAGLFTIDASGNILWGKYITNSSGIGSFSVYLPVPFYPQGIANNGLCVYNNTDTFFNKSTSSPSNDYTEILSQIDENGNLVAAHDAHLGVIGSGYNVTKYGATDWRGNVYLGGTFSNFMATPADSVVNTDHTSGNFFIAKLGISDCSCPTPGAQFTQKSHGDTVLFYGSSINHRDSIHWRLGDGSVSSSDTVLHIYANHDSTYTVTAIAYSGCGIDSITKQVTVRIDGIITIEPDKTNLYPNPVTNAVNLEVSGPATVGLILANGASVWTGPIQVNQQGTYVFDMSKYASALYYFIVQYPNGKTDIMQVVKK